MRQSIIKILSFCSLTIAYGFVSPSFLPVSEAQAASCRGGKGIGVHRTVRLNPTGGKRYGKSHGGAQDFLRKREVVLTFDDGPISSTTNKVLHALDQHCAKATFFMVASMAKNNPSLARKVANKGHTIGIHSYNHKNLGHLSGAKAVSDVNRSITAIEKAVGRDVAPFFRFPYLSENRTVNQHLKNLGYGVFAIDVDSLDYKFTKPASMVNRVMSELNRKGKGIILLHDIQKVTANGIAHLLDRLNDEGYKLVHIRGHGGKDPKEPTVMASVSTEKNDSRPARKNTRTGAWTLRASIDETKAARKKSTVLARLPNRRNPVRRAVKKRIIVSQTKPAANKPQRRQGVTRLTPQERFRKNQTRALEKLKKNKQAFRNAIKSRIIN